MSIEHEIDAKQVPTAIKALGALSLITAYMSAMSFFNASNTVFKSQFGIEGDMFNGSMFFAAVLSFAAFVLAQKTADEPKSFTQKQVIMNKPNLQSNQHNSPLHTTSKILDVDPTNPLFRSITPS